MLDGLVEAKRGGLCGITGDRLVNCETRDKVPSGNPLRG